MLLRFDNVTAPPIALAGIVQSLDEPLDDPSARHDLAQEHGPRFLGQPLGSARLVYSTNASS